MRQSSGGGYRDEWSGDIECCGRFKVRMVWSNKLPESDIYGGRQGSNPAYTGRTRSRFYIHAGPSVHKQQFYSLTLTTRYGNTATFLLQIFSI